MTDLAPHIAALRQSVDELVDATDLEPDREVFEAAVAANREAREHHDREMQRLQDEINRRVSVYGAAWEQMMRLAREHEQGLDVAEPPK